VLLQAGCSIKATHPVATQVQLALTASPGSGSPALPVVVNARVDNRGITRVWHCEGCGCGNGFSFTVLGPDGVAVATSDPRAQGPLCPDQDVPLEPGSNLSDRLLFAGTLYVTDSPVTPSPTYPAPAGLYTVVARFNYSTGQLRSQVTLERTTSFTWQP